MKLTLLVAASLLLISSASANENWTSFQNGGKTSFADEVAVVLNAETPATWEVTLDGYGQSSPVKYGKHVYVTFVSGDMKDTLHVWAVDFESGKVVWKRETKNSSPEKNTTYVSRAAPSPACDTNGVVAFLEGGNLIAYSPSGELRWERDLIDTHGPVKSRHGLASSLEQTADSVFVWVEREDEPYVLSISKATGETNWKSDGLGVTAWSSPRLIPLANGDTHLVLSGIGKLAGLDPKTGDHKWSFDEISGNSTPTPVAIGDGKFLIGATTGRGESRGGNAAKSNGVIEIKQDVSGTFKASYVWQAKRATSSFGSPLVHEGFSYIVNRSGVVYCLDLETGKEQYAKRTASSVWATPIAVGETLYLFGKDGAVTAVAAGNEFRELSSRNVLPPKGKAGSVLYAAAFADSAFLFRTGDSVFRMR